MLTHLRLVIILMGRVGFVPTTHKAKTPGIETGRFFIKAECLFGLFFRISFSAFLKFCSAFFKH
ncbi:MAG: hypothetical protein ABJZ69_19350, partial [Hyphomicrobiales bacterium]